MHIVRYSKFSGHKMRAWILFCGVAAREFISVLKPTEKVNSKFGIVDESPRKHCLVGGNIHIHRKIHNSVRYLDKRYILMSSHVLLMMYI